MVCLIALFRMWYCHNLMNINFKKTDFKHVGQASHMTGIVNSSALDNVHTHLVLFKAGTNRETPQKFPL